MERRVTSPQFKAGLRDLQGVIRMDLENRMLRLQRDLDIANNERDAAEYPIFKKNMLKLAAAVSEAKSKGQWRKEHFNLFEVLGYPNSRLEQIHSNVLAWLFNPCEAHGCGVRFLKEFMERFFQRQVLGEDGITVQREHQENGNRPDIIVRGPNWNLVVENKIDSAEGEKQSIRYVDHWRSSRNTSFAWITPTGWAPEALEFVPISYRHIHQVLHDLKVKADAGFLLMHFRDHIMNL